MSNIQELFRGIGVIIDDAFNPLNININKNIENIKKYFEDKNVPLITYQELPDLKCIFNFSSISFMILDWNLSGIEVEGVKIPDSLISDNIDFIRNFKSICFAPIFIFSNEDPDEIKTKLTQEGLYTNDDNDHIFVKSKSKLENIDVFSLLDEEWLKKTPSVYVLKEWELSMQKAKNEMFWDFYNINHEWAKILYDTISIDSGNHSYELNELLFEHVKSRSLHVEFEVSYFTSIIPEMGKKISQENKSPKSAIIPNPDMRKVLEGQRFRKNDLKMIFTGDIFTKGKKYFINIRPQCDCIPRNNGEDIGEIELYLLEGSCMTETQISKSYDETFGLFLDTPNFSSIFPINDGKAVRFHFKKFGVKSFKQLEDDQFIKIGTLLHPFSTKLIQKFTAYLQRQGEPRIPIEVISKINQDESKNEDPSNS